MTGRILTRSMGSGTWCRLVIALPKLFRRSDGLNALKKPIRSSNDIEYRKALRYRVRNSLRIFGQA
jgi:hypothetical protein